LWQEEVKRKKEEKEKTNKAHLFKKGGIKGGGRRVEGTSTYGFKRGTMSERKGPIPDKGSKEGQ